MYVFIVCIYCTLFRAGLLTNVQFSFNFRGRISVKKLYTFRTQVLNANRLLIVMKHEPVLRQEVKHYLGLKSGEEVVDATLGLGGHSKDILDVIGEEGRLYVFEQDEENLAVAKNNLNEFQKQITYFSENFRYFKKRITGPVDAILFDLGLSSPHVDEASRGFSFIKEGPLDMRFDKRSGLTAYDVVNTYPEEKLVEIFFRYGEEKFSKKIAREICTRRKKLTFHTTTELADFIASLIPKRFAKKHHPATQIFQALRMEVNDELNVLEEALQAAVEVLNVGGRIVIISYHSLEDRLVKQFFKGLMSPPPASYEQSLYSVHGEPFFEELTRKPVVPTPEEIQMNPRSRSAKLRAYRKVRELL